MFSSAGPCRSVELMNSRERDHTKNSNVIYLAAYVSVSQVHDPDDSAIYQAAQERFWDDVRKHDLNRDRCTQICSR
jgi:hypothetical protein